jgi:hypothetical protein
MFRFDKCITNSLIIGCFVPMIADLYLVKKSFDPMIADQEKINGCVRFAFQLLKVDIYFHVDMFY